MKRGLNGSISQLERSVIEACKEALESEEMVIDWIYEMGDLAFLPKKTVYEFVKNRLNNSLKTLAMSRSLKSTRLRLSHGLV